MTVEVDTKDCTSLTDAEIAEMADLCAEGPMPFEVGLLSKQAEEWVLVTTVRDDDELRGFVFSTLERVGGTPAVLLGMGSVARHPQRDTYLGGLMRDQMFKALMAFPDEDVLVGAQFTDPRALAVFAGLGAVVPRPGYKANGEDRAWGRRLAKRFDIAASRYDQRAFTVTGDGNLPRVIDHAADDDAAIPVDAGELFAVLDTERRDSLIVFSWAMAETLEALR